ncbi:Maf-like protein [Clostridia bacterium]|nr:Maf-like protein [Clostridia bacterium]
MIILASASPRRQELLKLITEDFIVLPADIDEIIPPELLSKLATEDVPEFFAVQKALHILRKHSQEYSHLTVIGADTIVVINGEILGKPKDITDAKRMLNLLSGKTHTVITGVAITVNGRVSSFSETAYCTFYPLTENEIDEYIATGEPLDKAGAYGIQGKGALLIKSIEGDYYSIMGLPVARISRLLK